MDATWNWIGGDEGTEMLWEPEKRNSLLALKAHANWKYIFGWLEVKESKERTGTVYPCTCRYSNGGNGRNYGSRSQQFEKVNIKMQTSVRTATHSIVCVSMVIVYGRASEARNDRTVCCACAYN